MLSEILKGILFLDIMVYIILIFIVFYAFSPVATTKRRTDSLYYFLFTFLHQTKLLNYGGETFL